MVDEYISRKALKELFDGIYDCADLVFEPDDQICSKQYSSCGSCRWGETKRAIQKRVMSIPAADVRPVPEGGIGEMSDGYHTFNGLYYQRMILFAALVKQNKDKAWKSYRHEDGELCFGGGWFIVGIDTPEGSYTYHYESKDFNLFDCEELPVAKHWDGHTEADVTRLLSIPAADVRPVVRGTWLWDCDYRFRCSACGDMWTVSNGNPLNMSNGWDHCPHCGAKMEG